jgi:reductive dehalogenase
MFLCNPISNPDIDDLAEILRSKQTKTLAAGIDVVMAELRESMSAPPTRVDHHTYAIVYLYEYPRDPGADEPGCEWLQDTQAERACLRAAETGAILSNYIRLLGYEARAHSSTSSDVDLNKLAVAAGLALVEKTAHGPVISNPYTGTRFGLCAITTTMELAPDKPLAPASAGQHWHTHGPAWWVGKGFAKNKFNQQAFRKRQFKDGAYPFERSKRVEVPTTLIDEPRIPRVPKRTDMFSRAIFGDMGKPAQDAARNGNYVRKSATSFASRRPLGAFVLLQDGPVAETVSAQALDAQRNADNIKAALYFLGADAVGISRCPEWVYYSHDAVGEPLPAYHPNAISVIIDQGFETMEGASGDDWIACSQSMRAYLRFSLLGGIIGDQIRNLGYGARVHTVMDGEVLQPPLLLLSGLGEVSRIGEVILNPYLGPRLKSGVITTDMPLSFDQPIDFGLQSFCEQCNKCARECPSGAITAGPKRMFNGYEIWKSDSQKCTTYRVTQAAGAMCGRCMKTCPWNLEGLFAEAPFRWMATHLPAAAKYLARMDDRLGHGSINPIKKWWWDLEMIDEGPYQLSPYGAAQRELQTDLDLKYEDQTLAVYPASLAPDPYPFPFHMDREAGIEAYEKLIGPEEYQARLDAGETENLAHEYRPSAGEAPVLRLKLNRVESMADAVSKYEFVDSEGAELPPFEAGAHLDVVVAPEFMRQYSLSGDPADRSKYQIAVLREDDGRGGSALLHRIFNEGRMVFVSRPINHFPLEEGARRTLLMGGGIGITPMLAMAHRLHAIGAEFELHYSVHDRGGAGFLNDIEQAPWRERAHVHISTEGTRARLDELVGNYVEGDHLYTCGPDAYMSSVLEAGDKLGWPDENLHREYFSVPEAPEYENHEFTLNLARSGRQIAVPAESNAAEALLAAGIHVDMKCSDGICGVCKCGVLEGEVEHRDYVLSNAQRADTMILCQSRALEPGAELRIDL